MKKQIDRWWRLAVTVALAMSACKPVSREQGGVMSSRAALTTTNGLAQNGLTTNGLVNNGFWNNGFWNNGFWNNGFWNNGFWNNGFWNNGFWNNGFWNNGFWNNGFWNNGFWNNGFWNNGFWNNGLDGTPSVQGEILRNNKYARELLQYIYSCAMPADGYDAILDPNLDSPISCSPSDAGSDGGTGCDDGYACSADGKCVIPLQGGGANGSGLGINADGTTWWGSGKCDETCQRWVSACVLARTNAYGVHVRISLRAPANAPQAIRDALAVSDVELHGADAGTDAGGEAGVLPYSSREGAYYGNIFATAPVNPLPSPGYSGPTTGPIASTPVYYACAGPDSNTPEITKRFCSSQGDQSVISVPGVCWPAATDPSSIEPPVCDGIDATGSIFGCYTSADTTQPRAHYDEVLTVYLQEPLTVCDNGVCEDGEDSPSDPVRYCPSDCHPGGWAKTFADLTSGSVGVAIFDYNGSSAISPDGQSVALVAINSDVVTHEISLGGAPLSVGSGIAVVGKYSLDGILLHDQVLEMPYNRSSVAYAADGSIVVAGFGRTGAGSMLSVAKMSPDVQLLPGWPITLGGTAPLAGADGRLATDSQGNVYLAARYIGTATFATTPAATSFTSTVSDSTNLKSAANADLCVVKIRPDASIAWAVTLGGFGSDQAASLSVTPSGDLLLSAILAGGTLASSTAVYTVSALDGKATLLKQSPTGGPPPTNFNAAVADSSGDLYITGDFKGTYDFGPGCGPSTASIADEFFLAKYSPDASTCRWVARAAIECPANAIYCPDGYFSGGALAFGPGGDVVVAGALDPLFGALPRRNAPPGIGAAVDFGSGFFDAYRYPGVFVAAYDAAGGFRWAKKIPIVLQGNFRGFNIDGQGNVVISGTYTGSMQVDDRLLVTPNPEFPTSQYESTYLASFAEPSSADKTPSTIGVASDQTGAVIDTVPDDIYTEATGPNGAKVFYMPPTAFDSGYAGTNVTCSPRPNTVFPIGTTTVSCVATDPLGNVCAETDPTCRARATFKVTVVDKSAPVFSKTSKLDGVSATNALSLTVATSGDPPAGVAEVTCAASTDPASSYTLAVNDRDVRTISCSPSGPSLSEAGSVPFAISTITVQSKNADGVNVSYPKPTATDQVDGNVTVTCVPDSGSTFPVGTTSVACTSTDAAGNSASLTFIVAVKPGFGTPCTSSAGCAVGACVDGVCCNTTADSCGQCQACNVPGSLGACAPTSGGACSDGNACTTGDTCLNGACVAGAPVTCGASDQCHVAGVCDPSTGACTNPSAPDGTSCDDGNACTLSDACSAGACVGGASPSCDDQNPCTVDSCDPGRGCVNAPGNAGAVCRVADDACDTPEACNGTDSACPPDTDHQPPALNPGSAQTVVGGCMDAPVAFAPPTLASVSCEVGTTITCTPISAKSYGPHTVTCTAKDASGNVSAPVSFTVTVLQPLTVRIQPPLYGDKDTIDNVVKAGSTVPTKILLYACDVDVTATAPVIAKLDVTYMASGGASVTEAVTSFNGAGDTNGVMVFDGSSYHYNLSTKGLSKTNGVPGFYEEDITVVYTSAPSVIVGSDAVQLDLK
jgi:hypothetical protein